MAGHIQILRRPVDALDPTHYSLLEEQVTAEHVKAHVAGIVQGEVVRHTVPSIGALNFVMKQALG